MHARLRKIRKLRRWGRFLQLNRFGRDERGVQLVELAIVLPILMVLFGAVAEFGRYFYEYSTLAKASRLSARYLATAGIMPSEYTAAQNLLVYGNTAGTGSPIVSGLVTSNVVITRQGGVSCLPATVTVQIANFKHQPILDLGQLTNIPSLTLNIDVKPSVTMRYLLRQPVTGCVP